MCKGEWHPRRCGKCDVIGGPGLHLQRAKGSARAVNLNSTIMGALRVLLIENDPEESERISSVLADAHHDVLSASGFEDASQALLVQKFDAVLLGSTDPADRLNEFTTNLRSLDRSHRNSGRTTILSFSPNLRQGSTWSPAADVAIDGYLPRHFEAVVFSDAVSTLAHAPARPAEGRESADSSELPVFDPEQFQAQVAHDRDLLIEIIDLFLLDRIDQVNEMRNALSSGDYNRLSRAAHTIKGSLSSLHAPQARAHAQDLESAAKNHEVQVCRFSLAQLEHDLDILEPELLSLRASAAGA